MCVRVYVRMYMFVYMFVYEFTCVRVCVRVCLCVYRVVFAFLIFSIRVSELWIMFYLWRSQTMRNGKYLIYIPFIFQIHPEIWVGSWVDSLEEGRKNFLRKVGWT